MDRQDVGRIDVCGRLRFAVEARAFRGNPPDNPPPVYSNGIAEMAGRISEKRLKLFQKRLIR
jgi:hypothetical protein